MCVIDIWRIAGQAGEWCGKFDGLEVPNLMPKYYFSKVEEEKSSNTHFISPKRLYWGNKAFSKMHFRSLREFACLRGVFQSFSKRRFLKKPLLPFLITNTCQTVAVRIPPF